MTASASSSSICERSFYGIRVGIDLVCTLASSAVAAITSGRQRDRRRVQRVRGVCDRFRPRCVQHAHRSTDAGSVRQHRELGDGTDLVDQQRRLEYSGRREQRLGLAIDIPVHRRQRHLQAADRYRPVAPGRHRRRLVPGAVQLHRGAGRTVPRRAADIGNDGGGVRNGRCDGHRRMDRWHDG